MGSGPDVRLGSVEADGVQKAPAALFLECLQQLADPVLHVPHELDALAQVADEECSQRSLLAGVQDVHVDHMHRLAGLLLPRIHIFHHLVGILTLNHNSPESEDCIENIISMIIQTNKCYFCHIVLKFFKPPFDFVLY